MAAITDKFNKAANGTGIYPSIASVSAIREKNGSILTCDDLSGWSTDTPVHFSTYRLLPDGTIDTSTQSDWKGIVNGNTITQMIRLAGNSDSGHLVGDKVELNPTIGWLDDLITGILKSHNQDGTIKDGVIQTKNIADKAITSNKIAAKAIRSQNIDFETINQFNYSTDEQVMGAWIDGSMYYRKIVTGTLPSSNAEKVVIPGSISNLGQILPMTSLNLQTPTDFSFPGGGGAFFYRFEISRSNGDISIEKTATGWRGAQVTAIIYYTKK